MSGHLETIVCPKCEAVQTAEVQHTKPWWTYLHVCECGYIITESEWQKVAGSDKNKSRVSSDGLF